MTDDVRFADKILENLLFNPQYAVKTIPFLKEEYFEGEDREIVRTIIDLYTKYGAVGRDETWISIKDKRGLSEKTLKDIRTRLYSFEGKAEINFDWLMAETEKFCKDRAMYLAILNSVEVISKNGNNEKIYKNIEDALAVSFETSIGHEYLEDAEKRFELYHTKEDKVSWGVKTLDQITNGGMSKKNLICAIAPTGSGKSLFMCAIVANCLRLGYNCLYISMEMSEQRVAERIDANLWHLPISEIHRISKERFMELSEQNKHEKLGRLFIKEYPTSGANVSHFKTLINELRVKKNFVPDMVVVDYMNICSSARVRKGDTNSYGYIKSISEELRGLAVEQNIVLLTATQTNRSGFDNSSITLKEVSESIGSIFVMDMAFALVRTEALDMENQIKVVQLKNRYSDISANSELFLGINRSLMKVYDLDRAGDFASSFPIGGGFVPNTVLPEPKPLGNGKNRRPKPEPDKTDTAPWEFNPRENVDTVDYSDFQF